MSKGGGGSPPPQPDVDQLGERQAQLNRVSTYTPFGNAVYFGPNRDSLRVDLSPAQQQILGGQQAIQQGMLSRGLSLQEYLPTEPLSFEGLPGQVTGVDINSGAANPFEQAIFQRQQNLLSPIFAEQREATMQDLANRGLPIAGEAYDNALDRLDRAQNAALTDAALGAVTQTADYGFRNAALQNQARVQGINERTALRGNQFNELAAILSGSPVQMPQQQAATPVDVVGPALAGYQGQLNAYNQQQANRQSTFGNLLSLGGNIASAAILSDRRMKEHAVPLRRHSKLPIDIHIFRYKGGDTSIGVMAQDVEKVKPEAVIAINGIKHVDYGALNV